MDVNEIFRRFTAYGVRPTPQRIAIYRYLAENPIHPTVDTVYEALLPSNPGFSRTTVYNGVKTLVDAGLIQPVTIDGGWVRYDANPAEHGHFKCLQCGQVFDFSLMETREDSPELDGFEVRFRNVYLNGLCPKCRGQQETANNGEKQGDLL